MTGVYAQAAQSISINRPNTDTINFKFTWRSILLIMLAFHLVEVRDFLQYICIVCIIYYGKP